SALVVPEDAIASRGQLQSVYVIDENGIARMRLVTLGRSFQGSTEILSGLDSGERFVTKVNPRLRDGLQIAGASGSNSR
ncbi:MAG: efflux RND transporter periplasmic adaptor subunit, partial [Acidobacteriota bacterium]